MMCTSVRVTYVSEPTKCRELLEVLDEHSVRQPRYPALVRDRKLCVPALLPVCPGRTTVQRMDFRYINDTLVPSKHGKVLPHGVRLCLCFKGQKSMHNRYLFDICSDYANRGYFTHD